MFFYTALFIASVITALIILFLYNALMDVGKAVYRAILPSSKDNLARHIDDTPYHATINDTPTPWGWDGQVAPAKRVKTVPVSPNDNTPWGWKGNDHEIREHGPKSAVRNASSGFGAFLNKAGNEGDQKASEQAAVGWPYREEKFEFAGKAYKVKRKTTLRKTNLETTGKPWGW